MHRGIREFVAWVESHRGVLALQPPASSEQLAAAERRLGAALPTDLRLLLQRFNGGELPGGVLLGVGHEVASIESFSERFRRGDELGAVPFYADGAESLEQAASCELHALDTQAGPVPDTWPVQSIDPHEPQRRPVVHRTLDGWCRLRFAEWSDQAPDGEPLLETYLRQGMRHVEVEPDVAAAHATVAHALRRLGRPEEALEAYLRAARCVPSEPWCDWEALVLAALLGRIQQGFEAASRLVAPAPAARWVQRGASPVGVAHVVARFCARLDPIGADRWLGLLDLLAETIEGPESLHVEAVRVAVAEERDPPPWPQGPRAGLALSAEAPPEAVWHAARKAYLEGRLRAEHLLLDPTLRDVASDPPLAELLRLRRDF